MRARVNFYRCLLSLDDSPLQDRSLALLTDLVSETRECERRHYQGLVLAGGGGSWHRGPVYARPPGAGDFSGSSVLSHPTVAASVDSRLGGIGPASLIPSRHINPVSLEMLAVAFGS